MWENTLPLYGRMKPKRLSVSHFLKRAFDIFGALVGLVILWPIFIVIAVNIKKQSPGPIFYRGSRAGLYGRPFPILKFRTMYVQLTDQPGPPITAHDDPRITPFGRLLRNSKLNELPQLWNVLKGDMSLVGPRPEDPAIVETWPENAFEEILSIRPGITSPASVLFRNEETLLANINVVEDYFKRVAPSKLRLDILYARNHTFLGDLDILFWTALTLISLQKEWSISENSLFWGPFARLVSRYVSWLVVDFFVSYLAIGFTGLIWRTSGPLDIGVGNSLLAALGIAILFTLVNAIFGVHKIEWSRARPWDALDLVLTSAITIFISVLINLQLQPLRLPIGLLIVSGILALIGFVAARYRTRLVTGIAMRWMSVRKGASSIGERVLIIGAGETAQFTTWLLRNGQLAHAFVPVGLVDDDPRKLDTRIDGCEVIGTTAEIPKLVKDFDVGVILFAISNIDKAARDRLVSACQATPAQVVIIPDLLQIFKQEFTRKGLAYHPELYEYVKPNGSSMKQKEPAVWLAELNEMANDGNWTQLHQRIRELQALVEVEKSKEY